MSAIIALDPGLAHCGYGVLRLPAPGRVLALDRAQAHYVTSGTWHTDPKLSLEARVAELSRLATELAQEHGATAAVLERQTIGGTYARNRRKGADERKQARSLQSQQTATGGMLVLLAMAGLSPVYFAPPVRLVHRTDVAIRRVLPELTKRTSEHERAALALGLRELSDFRRRWADPAATFGHPIP
jgi:hypothetical protein